MRKHVNRTILCIGLSAALAACGIKKSVNYIPDISSFDSIRPVVSVDSDTLCMAGSNYRIKNASGQWEMFLKGDPYQRGLIYGALNQSLLSFQDSVFFETLKAFVPTERRQQFIRKFLRLYNRNMYKHIPQEYLVEIYGLSHYTSSVYDKWATPYLRALYLHGAHDIGHALNDMMLVGCSSMAVWGDKTEDGSLLIGRNFDFYAGDGFALNKLISFIKPESGYAYMSVAWPGMIGVVSGMNEKGLTATINAGKSKIPWSAKTPVTLLVREIIQYASTIEEAVAIAKSKKVFVSESIMIGSAADKRAVIIEVSPGKTGVYEVRNSDQLICSNHFQSETYKKDKRNKKWMEESHSVYRYQKMEELLQSTEKITPEKMAGYLRTTEGIGGASIGYGNEKALNQLLAHHGVIFQPEKRRVWVSSSPYQLGEFVAYDLNKIFDKSDTNFVLLESEELNIPADEFIQSEAYKNYEQYRKLVTEVNSALKNGSTLDEKIPDRLIRLNADFWEGYYKAGVYYYQQKEYRKAAEHFEKALTKEITTVPGRKSVEKYLDKSKKKLRR